MNDEEFSIPGELAKGEEFWFFEDVSSYFKFLISAVLGAERSIRICFFTFQGGRVADELLAVLLKKAEQGVSISLLVDSVGMMADEIRFGFLSHAVLKKLSDAGVQTGVMRVVSPGRLIPISAFGRLHSKMVVIDDEQVLTGGSNIGDWYLGTVDSNLVIKGEVAKEYAAYFDYLFRLAKDGVGQDQIPIESIPWTKKIRQKFKQARLKKGIKGHYVATRDQATLLMTFPGKRRDIRRAFISDLMTARELIQIRTWIFVPDPLLLWIIGQKAKTGVRVQVLRSQKCKVFLANLAASFCDQWLQKRGVEIFHYHRAPFHAKSWLCDEVLTVGNANVDTMSLLGNHETMLRLVHPGAAKRMKQFFEDESAVSLKMTDGDKSSLKNFFAYLFFGML